MGYRNPAYEDEDDAGPFEWDGDRQRWLFYRNGSAAPVVVDQAEKDRFETVQKSGRIPVFAAFAAAVLMGEDWFAPLYTTHDAGELARLNGFAVGITIYVLGTRLIDWVATRPFRDRPSVGLRRPRADAILYVAPEGPLGPLLVLAFAGFLAWLHWPPGGLADRIWLGVAALVAAVGVLSLLPARKRSQL